MKQLLQQKNDRDDQEATRLGQELQHANGEIARLSKALEQCKDQIFGMQPEQQLSDSQICDQYERFCESVSDWVDTVVGDSEGYMSKLRYVDWSSSTVKMLEAIFPGGSSEIDSQYPQAETLQMELLSMASCRREYSGPGSASPACRHS